MTADQDIALRPAQAGDAQAVFEITHVSIATLGKEHYSADQLAGWMGARTPAYYEALIANGRMIVAVRQGAVIGFVDAEPGEVTRLFLRPDAAGSGLGKRLLGLGIEQAREGHAGPVKVEATVNAEGFYRRHGFRTTGKGFFSHGQGGDPIEIVHMEL
ncbi:GNAT family N-acetyltransferase [Bosea sp. 685]|uniref:GNAT family N-acetyltransferase n=1 Tax=Bosea sp. 685 TaxID=3080057 RepID=UPI00289353B3|nr:GNAT family N-acetyltransferase [Bosea sp. 685]WNJ92180.1 GNAT family N-acetyltransferase [Bosea sp. 685]